MIRINLLAEGRRPVVARKSKPSLSLGGQDPNNLLMIVGLIVGLLVAGGWWYRLNAELSDMNRKVNNARQEFDSLKDVIQQVEEFKKKKENLENKVAVIKDLKRKQKGPVNIMDKISRALPDLVWLSNMTVAGTTVNLTGQAFNTNAVAAFIENLDEVEEFKEPNATDIRIANRSDAGQQVYGFRISFDFVPKRDAEEESEVAEGP